MGGGGCLLAVLEKREWEVEVHGRALDFCYALRGLEVIGNGHVAGGHRSNGTTRDTGLFGFGGGNIRQGCTLTTLLNFQIVNAKGEMKGSAITGPVGKEAAELWPVRTYYPLSPDMRSTSKKRLTYVPPAYRIQLRCCHVKKGKGYQ